jgi:RHS repeat-associated protein
VAQNDGTTTGYFGYDGLGSVRQMLDGSGGVLFAQVFDPYGNLYGSLGTEITSWGFTGEQTDADGLIFLRSRYYEPSQGRFLSRDEWLGTAFRPVSLNKWAYVGGDPVNATDPSGRERVKIWAAAFISPASIVFPHFYFVYNEFTGQGGYAVDTEAEWKGDNRDFYSGLDPVGFTSRIWHEVVIELDPMKPVEVSNRTGVGETRVTYTHFTNGNTITESDYADPSPPAKVYRINSCTTNVDIVASGANPLSPPGTPYINYTYHLQFNICKKQLTYEGKHDRYPWHELWVSGFGLLRDFSPKEGSSPLDLFWLFGQVRFGPRIRELEYDQCISIPEEAKIPIP